MTDVITRPMRWWDIPAVMAIEESAFPTTAWSPSQFWSELAQPDRTYFVTESADRVVAYAGVMVRPPTADVQTIAVEPGHRGQGTGRDLLIRMLGVAEASGCTEVLLEVSADNAPAVGLYETEGFEVIARRSSYYAPGRDALIMRRRRP
jgi:ribosomal-protein-alanine N-acetyltransferase